MAARTPPWRLVTRNRAALDVDVEDEVRAQIYGEPTGAVTALGAAEMGGENEFADEPGPGAGAVSAIAVAPQPARDADVQSGVLGGELAAALLEELDPAAREEVLARAAVELSAARVESGEPRARCSGAGREAAAGYRGREGAAGYADREGPPRCEPAPACERSIARDDRVSTMPRYRVVIDRGRGDLRSHAEFSARAPSARGAVAAYVPGLDSSVSAVNEVEPADRFSWRPDGSCECTPASFTNCANGSELDAEGWCRECGLQVLPPRTGLADASPARRGPLHRGRAFAKLVRRLLSRRPQGRQLESAGQSQAA